MPGLTTARVVPVPAIASSPAVGPVVVDAGVRVVAARAAVTTSSAATISAAMTGAVTTSAVTTSVVMTDVVMTGTVTTAAIRTLPMSRCRPRTAPSMSR